jgi:murein L,D-transpeptidase YcbB/YkuD
MLCWCIVVRCVIKSESLSRAAPLFQREQLEAMRLGRMAVAGMCATIAVLVCAPAQAALIGDDLCEAVWPAAETASRVTSIDAFSRQAWHQPVPAVTSTVGDGDRPRAESIDQQANGSDSSPNASQPSTEQPGAEPLPPPADPTVTEVRARLADTALRKGAASDDLAALETFYGELTGPPLWITTNGFSAKAQAIIKEIEQADDWGLQAKVLNPPAAGDAPSTTELQAIDELKLSLAILKYARFARGGRLSPLRVSRLFDQRPPPIDPNAIIREIAASGEPASYLCQLHPKQEQFGRLRQALLEARANAGANEALIQRLIINMERWRWMPPDLGSLYIWNNIPELKARVVKDGSIIYEERIIVGKLSTPTPVLSATVQSIVFHPEWLLPGSVVEEELKPAFRNVPAGEPGTAIFKQRNLKVRLKGSPVDVETVDWSAADLRQYTFVQPPGPGNALGKLKFNFPNRHAVYMHDTSRPELFNETTGALSHGCIRLRHPERLATLLLAEDKGWGEQQVSDMLSRGKTRWVKLTRPVSVYLTYFTVVDGETFPDTYGLDSRMSSALFGDSSTL